MYMAKENLYTGEETYETLANQLIGMLVNEEDRPLKDRIGCRHSERCPIFIMHVELVHVRLDELKEDVDGPEPHYRVCIYEQPNFCVSSCSTGHLDKDELVKVLELIGQEYTQEAKKRGFRLVELYKPMEQETPCGIKDVAIELLKKCTDDYAQCIWEKIGCDVMRELGHSGGFTENDIALAIGNVLKTGYAAKASRPRYYVIRDGHMLAEVTIKEVALDVVRTYQSLEKDSIIRAEYSIIEGEHQEFIGYEK